MSQIKIAAAARLQTKVTALTDIKGAVAFVQSVFDKHELGVKVIPKKAAPGGAWDWMTCKGKLNGKAFEFSIELAVLHGKADIVIDMHDSEALTPEFEDAAWTIDTFELKKGSIKDADRNMRLVSKYMDALTTAQEDAEVIYDWWRNFGDALTELHEAKEF